MVEDSLKLLGIFLQNLVGHLEGLLVLHCLRLVLDCQRRKVVIEEVLELVGQSREFVATTCVSHCSRSRHGLEELPLEDDLQSIVRILSIDISTFSSDCRLVLLLLVRDVTGLLLARSVFLWLGAAPSFAHAVHLVELVLVLGAKKSKVVLGTLVVDPVELS